MKIMQYFYITITTIGEFTVFSLKAFLNLFRPPIRLSPTISQLNVIGTNSIPIITISNLAIGMIFSLQMTIELRKFGAETLTANVLAQALARELCPVTTALMLIAKNGSAFTSQISSMVTSEQISVMKTMGVSPTHYIVTPRLIASIIMYPVLTGLANLSGLFGAAIIFFSILNTETAFAIDYMFKRLEPLDIVSGLFKSLIMGIAVCLICCYYGFKTEKGSTGIGKSTTKAVVMSSIAILLIDLFLGQVFHITGLV